MNPWPLEDRTMVNLQDTPTAGPLTATDLDAARKVNTGRIYRLDTHRPLPAGCDGQGRHETRRFGQQAEFVDTIPTDFGAIDDGAAVEGGKHRDPVESMLQHRRVSASIKYGLALAALLAVAGYFSRIAWPLLG
jgi:hypothetical protein